MRIERTCLSCKKKFIAQKEKQYYCCKKCFKREYHKRKRLEKKNEDYPVYVCKECGKSIELAFNPLEDFLSWSTFKCPYCHPDTRHEFGIIMSSERIFITF